MVIKVPLLGIRIAALLSILLCVFTLELCWLNEHKARLELNMQEELAIRDYLHYERRVLEDKIIALDLQQRKLSYQMDLVMSFGTRSGKWEDFVQFSSTSYARSLE